MQSIAVTTFLMLLSSSAEPAAAEFEQSGVRVRVTVKVGQYYYDVTNSQTAPITRFEISQLHTYKHQSPMGWQTQGTDDRFMAWTDEPIQGIQPGNSGRFSMCVGSGGAVLGQSPARVVLADGRTIEVPGVWCPQPRSFRSAAVLTVLLAGVVLAHALWVFRQPKPRGQQGSIT